MSETSAQRRQEAPAGRSETYWEAVQKADQRIATLERLTDHDLRDALTHDHFEHESGTVLRQIADSLLNDPFLVVWRLTSHPSGQALATMLSYISIYGHDHFGSRVHGLSGEDVVLRVWERVLSDAPHYQQLLNLTDEDLARTFLHYGASASLASSTASDVVQHDALHGAKILSGAVAAASGLGLGLAALEAGTAELVISELGTASIDVATVSVKEGMPLTLRQFGQIIFNEAQTTAAAELAGSAGKLGVAAAQDLQDALQTPGPRGGLSLLSAGIQVVVDKAIELAVSRGGAEAIDALTRLRAATASDAAMSLALKATDLPSAGLQVIARTGFMPLSYHKVRAGYIVLENEAFPESRGPRVFPSAGEHDDGAEDVRKHLDAPLSPVGHEAEVAGQDESPGSTWSGAPSPDTVDGRGLNVEQQLRHIHAVLKNDQHPSVGDQLRDIATEIIGHRPGLMEGLQAFSQHERVDEVPFEGRLQNFLADDVDLDVTPAIEERLDSLGLHDVGDPQEDLQQNVDAETGVHDEDDDGGGYYQAR